MIEENPNPVLEFYLKEENKNKKLSRDTLTKKLNLTIFCLLVSVLYWAWL